MVYPVEADLPVSTYEHHHSSASVFVVAVLLSGAVWSLTPSGSTIVNDRQRSEFRVVTPSGATSPSGRTPAITKPLNGVTATVIIVAVLKG